jgi:hypothetical protein
VNRNLVCCITLGALTLTPAAGRAQSRRAEAERQSNRDFRWEGSVPEGRWLYLRNLSGEIRVERASGNRVEITAEKSWRRGNPDDVRVEVTRVGSGDQDLLVCGLWRDNSECDENGYRMRDERRNRDWDRNNDVALDFVVRLPAGVKLAVSTVNGGVDVDGATSEVEATAVNGGVTARSSGGPVNATTVNGNIDVRMGSTGDGDLRFETVNGSVEVWVPDGLDAVVDMRTVNGRVGSDFPMTVSGRINPRSIRATIGRGGRRIQLETVNGSVELRKS